MTPDLHVLMAATLGVGTVSWFSAVVAGDPVPRKKPATNVYHWVLDWFGLAPIEALAIEDSVLGTAAALGAGLPVLAIRSMFSVGDTLPPVMDELDGLGEPGAPASGQALGQPWQGVVDMAQLRK